MRQINDDLIYKIGLAMGAVLSQDEQDRLQIILMDLCLNSYQEGYDEGTQDTIGVDHV